MERPSTQARAAGISRRFRRRRGGMIGPSSIRGRGRGESKGIIHSYRQLASTASRPAGCWPISTRSRARCRSLKGIPNTPARGDATARKAPQLSTRLPIPIASSTRSNAPANEAKVGGNAPRGTKRSTRSLIEYARQSSRIVNRRSCTTSAGPAKTVSLSASWRPGESMVITRTPTSAHPAVVKVTNSGWASIVPVRIMPTRK